MSGNSQNHIGYYTRTLLGFLIIAAGVLGGLYLAWWLSSRGDIIEIIHAVKMGLPAWAWLVLKFGLAAAFGLVFLLVFIALGMAVLGGGKKE